MPRYIADNYLYRAIGAEIDGACGKCAQSRSNCMYHSLSRMDICGIIDDAPTADVFDILEDIFEEYVSNCSDDTDVFQKADDFISAICTFASFHSPDRILMWETWCERKKYIKH